jgi:probable DNA repair protein
VVERLFREVLEPEALRQACVRGERSGTVAFAVEGGRPLADYPEPAAALVALRAISRPVLSGELALLLEAPWWGPGDRGARARIAARLRADIPQRILTKSIAARLRALAGEGADLARIEGCASAIDAAVARVAAGPGADAHWASVFDAALRALGWPGAGNADSGTQQARLQWRALLEVFVGVSRMEPPRDASRAVDLLAALARREQFAPSSGDVAVLVTAATEAPVARYDGIRVCGLQADRFPAPVQVDPFVPWALQREAGIPRASPEGQLALAASAIDAWRRCTDELVLSWALGEDDAHWMPSPLLAPWQADPAAYRDDATVAQAREAKAAALARSLPVGLRAAAGAGASLEPWRDEQGLPWDPAEALPGGTGALDDQLACPFRAYATRRLHARADEEAEQGISDLERGRLLHLALKIFWDETLDSRRLASLDVAARRDRLQAAVERAVDELGQAGDGDVLRTRLLARERARAVEVGLEALALDATREPFEVLLREAPVEAPVGPARIAGRIDRADRLVGDGSIVIIDYKSGRPRPMKWDGAEMTALQLWSYAIMVESLGIGEVRAVGNLHLARHGIRYAALAESAAGLPDADADGWKEARDDARERLPALAAAFLAGTAQVAPRAHACEHCDLTALCRRSELGLDAPDDDAEGGS